MMPDLHRESLSVLSEIWSLSPDVRFGQHLDFFGFLDEVQVNPGLATIEDDEPLTAMYRQRSVLLDRAQGPSPQVSQTTSVHTSVSSGAKFTDITLASEKVPALNDIFGFPFSAIIRATESKYGPASVASISLVTGNVLWRFDSRK